MCFDSIGIVLIIPKIQMSTDGFFERKNLNNKSSGLLEEIDSDLGEVELGYYKITSLIWWKGAKKFLNIGFL